jgi:hypothetical protein
MDLMFRKAAKNLPPNALLGTDAGYWAGVRVEAMEALDAFAVEIQYLNDAEKEKKGPGDASNLRGYQEQVSSVGSTHATIERVMYSSHATPVLTVDTTSFSPR